MNLEDLDRITGIIQEDELLAVDIFPGFHNTRPETVHPDRRLQEKDAATLAAKVREWANTARGEFTVFIRQSQSYPYTTALKKFVRISPQGEVEHATGAIITNDERERIREAARAEFQQELDNKRLREENEELRQQINGGDTPLAKLVTLGEMLLVRYLGPAPGSAPLQGTAEVNTPDDYTDEQMEEIEKACGDLLALFGRADLVFLAHKLKTDPATLNMVKGYIQSNRK